MQRKTITIRDDQEEWLEENPSVNLSGLVQQALDKEMGGDR